jgi:hypothetical protein
MDIFIVVLVFVFHKIVLIINLSFEIIDVNVFDSIFIFM